MDSFVTVLVVAAWLLLMVPAAFVMFLGGASADTEERPARAMLAVVSQAEEGERDERLAA